MKIMAPIILALALLLQGPQLSGRNTALGPEVPYPAASPNFQPACMAGNGFDSTGGTWTTAAVTCRLGISDGSEQAFLIGVSNGSVSSPITLTDSNGSPSMISTANAVGDAKGSVALWIEPNAATGVHTFSITPPTGGGGNNYATLWVAWLVHVSSASPVITAATQADGRSSGTVDSMSCGSGYALSGTNLVAVTFFGVPGRNTTTAGDGTTTQISYVASPDDGDIDSAANEGYQHLTEIEMNLSSLSGVYPFTGTNGASMYAFWMFGSWASSPPTIFPQASIGASAPGLNAAYGCVEAVFQADAIV